MLEARFTLEDFLVQMREMKKLGPLQDLLAMLPSVPGGKNALKDLEVDDGQLGRAEAIIQSMTREERQNPAIIGGSRRLRIARGSGVDHRGRQRAAQGVRAGEEDDEDHDGRQAHAPGPGDAEPPGYRLGDPPHVGSDQVEAARGEEAPLLPRRGGRPAQPSRRPVHREHRQVPPPRRPVVDRDRRGARAVLAPRRRAALQHRSDPDDQGRHLGAVHVREVRSPRRTRSPRRRPDALARSI